MLKSFEGFATLYLPSSGRNILDDFREAYYWLWQNTHEDATVMSWWDYGYQARKPNIPEVV